jgi:hypothetical protein
MYPPTLAAALRDAGIDTTTVAELGLNGRSDPDVLAAAVTHNRVLLTENVADFARICAERLTAGGHHPGVLIASSSRFSRRPAGVPRLAAAVHATVEEQCSDRVIYLTAPGS